MVLYPNTTLYKVIKSPNRTKLYRTYFLFLLSTPLFLMSFFEREDPAGTAYCMGERAGEVAETAIVVGGKAAVAGGGTETGGAAAGSGRDLGKMCFKRLFRKFFQK